MEIINKRYGFKYEGPDDYIYIGEEEYAKYNIDKDSTVGVFVKVEKDGSLTSLSINRDADVEDEYDYLSLISLNMENMEKVGMKIVQYSHHNNGRGRIDIIHSEFNGLAFITYFTRISKIMVACSVEASQIKDIENNVIVDMFDSFEEID